MNSGKNVYILYLLLIAAIVSYFYFFSFDFEHKEKKADENFSSLEKIDLKSAIITMNSTVPLLGSDIETKIYLDDYGKKYCTVTETRLSKNGQSISTITISIVKNGFTYSYNPEKKTGTKSINSSNFNPTKIDFAGLDEQTMMDHGIKKIGKDTILGKVCEVFTINYPGTQMSGRYDVWQTIPLHTSTHFDDLNMEMMATNILENVTVPDSIFDIPDDITFTSSPGELTSPSLPSPSKNP